MVVIPKSPFWNSVAGAACHAKLHVFQHLSLVGYLIKNLCFLPSYPLACLVCHFNKRTWIADCIFIAWHTDHSTSLVYCSFYASWQAFVRRELSADMDMKLYYQMIQMQQLPAMHQYFQQAV